MERLKYRKESELLTENMKTILNVSSLYLSNLFLIIASNDWNENQME